MAQFRQHSFQDLPLGSTTGWHRCAHCGVREKPLGGNAWAWSADDGRTWNYDRTPECIIRER